MTGHFLQKSNMEATKNKYSTPLALSAFSAFWADNADNADNAALHKNE